MSKFSLHIEHEIMGLRNRRPSKSRSQDILQFNFEHLLIIIRKLILNKYLIDAS